MNKKFNKNKTLINQINHKSYKIVKLILKQK